VLLGFRCKVGTMQELRAAVCCSAPACAGDEALEGAQMESLSHILVHCPVVRPAVAWLRGMWAMLVAGRVPLLDARFLLLGTTLCGTPAGVRPGLSCGPTCAFCSAVRFGARAAAEWPMCICSLLLLWWP
jgi:hypothetical protein